ncbi:hypothetical protein [Reticulibacter mediterranei]|uniref:hypothetical protein n=1 Tax=Reticulibacter mediterranei TaxID=2778369 RepID=UPI001C68DCC9|nr:hypothetical protein [Reticulibacter mediterranei]
MNLLSLPLSLLYLPSQLGDAFLNVCQPSPAGRLCLLFVLRSFTPAILLCSLSRHGIEPATILLCDGYCLIVAHRT